MEIIPTKIVAANHYRTSHAPNFTQSLASLSALLAGYLRVGWRSVSRHASVKPKMLSVRGTAALGEKRFVSVVQFERQRFLVGCSASSVTLLAQLPDEPSQIECDGRNKNDRNKDGRDNDGHDNDGHDNDSRSDNNGENK